MLADPQENRGLGMEQPQTARIHDYLLGGAHNFCVDRRAADSVLAVMPAVAQMVRGNRAFVRRAVRYAAGLGVRQFLDLGAGIPGPGSVHDTAAAAVAGSRVVYVDNDPTVVAYLRHLVCDSDAVAVVEGDVRDPQALLANPGLRSTIDFDEPVAVLLAQVLQFIAGDIAVSVTQWRQAIASGSLLVLSHASTSMDNAHVDALTRLYADSPTPLRLRTVEAIRGLVAGLDVMPGVVDADQPSAAVPGGPVVTNPLADETGHDRLPWGIVALVARKRPPVVRGRGTGRPNHDGHFSSPHGGSAPALALACTGRGRR